MRKGIVSVMLAVVFVSGAGVAAAQTTAPPAADQALDQLRKDARAGINTLITGSMQFSSDDAVKFWPLYKTYEQTRKGLTDERIAIIKDFAQNYAAMNDAKALELMQRALSLEDKLAAAKRAFLAELQKSFPGKTVARFYQVNNRIDMLIDLQFASEVPLVK